MIRLYQCQNGNVDEQFDDEDDQQFDEEEDQQNAIQEALRNLGIENLSDLEAMGLDVNQLDESNILSFIQIAQNVGGIEGLQQLIEQQNSQNEQEDNQQAVLQEIQNLLLKQQVSLESDNIESQQQSEEVIRQFFENLGVEQMDENVLDQLRQLSVEELQQVVQTPAILQALLNGNQEIDPEDGEQDVLIEEDGQVQEQHQTQTFNASAIKSPKSSKNGQDPTVQRENIQDSNKNGDEFQTPMVANKLSSGNQLEGGQMIEKGPGAFSLNENPQLIKDGSRLLNTADQHFKYSYQQELGYEKSKIGSRTASKNQSQKNILQTPRDSNMSVISQLTTEQINRMIKSIKKEKDTKNKMLMQIRNDPCVNDDIQDLPLAVQTS